MEGVTWPAPQVICRNTHGGHGNILPKAMGCGHPVAHGFISHGRQRASSVLEGGI